VGAVEGSAVSGTWPDGQPVHDLTLHVCLACGHERNARGWRGEEGATYYCGICHVLTTMEEIALTDEAPGGWSFRGEPLPSCPGCGAAPGAHHGSRCAADGFWQPVP
jgi:rubrerythrin